MTQDPVTIIDLWTIFHDGTIEYVTGEVPGELQIDVSIEYLRQRFPHPGDTFTVALKACRSFEYKDYESEVVIRDLPTISELGLGVLSAEEVDGPQKICRVFCESGTLDMNCDSFRLFLDQETEITLNELGEVASSYWNEFGSSSE